MAEDKKLNNKEIYVIGVEPGVSRFVIDSRGSKRLIDLHREKLVDALFLAEDNYPMIGGYCRGTANDIAPIELIETGRLSQTDAFLEILSYLKREPDKNRLVYLREESELEEIANLFKNAGLSFGQFVIKDSL